MDYKPTLNQTILKIIGVSHQKSAQLPLLHCTRRARPPPLHSIHLPPNPPFSHVLPPTIPQELLTARIPCAVSQCEYTFPTGLYCKTSSPQLAKKVRIYVFLPVMYCFHVEENLGRPLVLGAFLRLNLPLLFPDDKPALAHVIVQGVLCPMQAEIPWLGACLAGADGWVNICVGLGAKE